MGDKKALLLSIKHQHAIKIISGEKIVELRRKCPKVNHGDILLLYVPSPVKALIAVIRVDHIVSGNLDILWRLVKCDAGVTRSEFENYFSGVSRGWGIYLDKVLELKVPVTLSLLKERIPNFHPPQAYQYLTEETVQGLLTEEYVLQL